MLIWYVVVGSLFVKLDNSYTFIFNKYIINVYLLCIYKQEFIYHSPRGWKVQDQGAVDSVAEWEFLSMSKMVFSHLLKWRNTVLSHGGRQKGQAGQMLCEVLFIRTLLTLIRSLLKISYLFIDTYLLKTKTSSFENILHLNHSHTPTPSFSLSVPFINLLSSSGLSSTFTPYIPIYVYIFLKILGSINERKHMIFVSFSLFHLLSQAIPDVIILAIKL